MPRYDFRCAACAHVHEARSARPENRLVRSCPRCGNVAHQTISAPAIHFNAPGFYHTDSRRA